MSYKRPVVLTDGDIVSTVYFKRERLRWIQYEQHDHVDITSGEDGGLVDRLTEAGAMSLIRSRSDWLY